MYEPGPITQELRSDGHEEDGLSSVLHDQISENSRSSVSLARGRGEDSINGTPPPAIARLRYHVRLMPTLAIVQELVTPVIFGGASEVGRTPEFHLEECRVVNTPLRMHVAKEALCPPAELQRSLGVLNNLPHARLLRSRIPAPKSTAQAYLAAD